MINMLLFSGNKFYSILFWVINRVYTGRNPGRFCPGSFRRARFGLGRFAAVVSSTFWGWSFRPKNVSRFGLGSFRPNFNQDQDSLPVKRRNDNHSIGVVIGVG